MPPGDNMSPTPPTPVYNPDTKRLEVPTSTTTALPHSVVGMSEKVIAPDAVLSQMELERARKAQEEVQNQTVPLDKLPDDLLTPDELERRWEGGINKPPQPAPQIPVSMRPGMAPVAMAPDPNAPIPPAEPEGITRAEFEDRLARKKALDTESMEIKIRQQKAERDASLARQREQEVAKFNADMAEVAKMSSPEFLFAKPSIGARIINAIAAGLGAYGATLSGSGRNYALDIILKRQEEDTAMRKFALQNALKRAEVSGKSVEQIAKMEEVGNKKDAEARIAQNHWIDAQMAKMQAVWPAKAQAVAQTRADLQAKNAQDTRDFFAQYGGGTKTGTEYGAATTVTEGSKGKTDSRAPMNVIDSYVSMRNRERDMRAGGDVIANQKAFEEWRQAYRDQLRTEIQSRGGFKAITNMGQVLGAVELNLADRLKTPEARAVNKAMIPIVATQARKLDEVGAMSDMTIQKAEDSLGLASTTPREMASLAYQMADDAKRKADIVASQYPTLSEEGGPRVPPEGQTPEQKSYTAKVSKQIESDKAAAKPLTAKVVGKATKSMPADVKAGVRKASGVPKSSPTYGKAQQYIREMVDKYGGSQ